MGSRWPASDSGAGEGEGVELFPAVDDGGSPRPLPAKRSRSCTLLAALVAVAAVSALVAALATSSRRRENECSQTTESASGSLKAGEVDFAPASEAVYLGSPSIARCGGSVVVTRDHFGAGRTGPFVTTAFASSGAEGDAWERRGEAEGVYWATLFERDGDLYLLGTSDDGLPNNAVTISRSRDCGHTWSARPVTLLSTTGPGHSFTSGPGAVLAHGGRLWRALEVRPDRRWAETQSVFLLSAPDTSETDLMDARSWRKSDELPFEGSPRLHFAMRWSRPGMHVPGGWLEGNPVELPDGGVGVLIRVNSLPAGDVAALMRLEADMPGGQLGETRFVSMPGGHSKFTVRRHPGSGLYVALVNPAASEDVVVNPACAADPDGVRLAALALAGNTTVPPVHCSGAPLCTPRGVWCRAFPRIRLSLAVSEDLEVWREVAVLREENSGDTQWLSEMLTGFQYADWIFDGPGGKDLLVAVRTAADGANSFHNSNRITFQAVRDWQSLLA